MATLKRGSNGPGSWASDVTHTGATAPTGADVGGRPSTSTDPDTMTVHVPLSFRRHSGRKRVTAPDGSSAFAPGQPRPDTALVKALARAFRWRKLIETGIYPTIQEIADAEKINASYVGRVLRLALLAPDIIEAILDGRLDHDLTIDELLKPFPVDWREQRQTLSPALG